MILSCATLEIGRKTGFGNERSSALAPRTLLPTRKRLAALSLLRTGSFGINKIRKALFPWSPSCDDFTSSEDKHERNGLRNRRRPHELQAQLQEGRQDHSRHHRRGRAGDAEGRPNFIARCAVGYRGQLCRWTLYPAASSRVLTD